MFLREFYVRKITIYLIISHIFYAYVFLFVFVLIVVSNSVVLLLHLSTVQTPKECSDLKGRTTGLRG